VVKIQPVKTNKENSTQLPCLYTNATTLNKKIDELLIEIQRKTLPISETW
jgi:hypothetical protein